ncbi:NUDIX domain-containing protein [Streptomyces sp. Ncost-T10-10d]|uniref:NUDIX domain-containing protein n=1 Tax=Streptomyces sp. Ncost-T10-10d TaxID=1839774 RepID=UPI00210BA66E|nr:NUDIX domain-containing protein [Streptomyces sp. Ncost-T10-10d]
MRDSDIVKTLSSYMHERPGERTALMPLYDALRDHAGGRSCSRGVRCPMITAGAIVVDEQNRVLALRNETRWALAEGLPEDGDDSLDEVALRVLREEAGFHGVWTMPGVEGPILIDARHAAPEFGPRLRVGFRFLFRAHSEALLPTVIEAGRAGWVASTEIGIPDVAERVEQYLGVLT